MPVWLRYLLLCCLLVVSELGQPVRAQIPDSISVGIVADNEPYSGYGRNGPEGFSVDVLNKISELTGIRFEYRVGSWTDIYSAFLRKELDAIDEVSWREDRVNSMLFTRPYHIRQTVILHDANRPLPEIRQLSDLKGYRIGVLRDVYYLESLRNAGLELIEYSLQPEMIHALSFGWVDAIVGSEVTLSYFARQLGQLSLELLGTAPLNGQESEDFRIAVQKDAPTLHRQLDDALARIDPNWLRETQERWQEYGGRSLQARQVRLTPAQQAMLRQQGPLRVGLMRDYAPLSFEDGGQIQGLTVDILARIMDTTGLRAMPVVGQWHQLIELFQRGEIDIMANISDLPSRREYSRFTQPYHFVSVVGFTKSADYRLTSKESLKGLRVGYGEGIFYADALRREIGDNAIAFSDQASMFIALANGQIDLVLAALDNGNHWLREQGQRDVHIAGELTLDDVIREDLRFAIRPELEALVPILNLALDGITPTERRVIENRWLGAQIATRTPAPSPLELTATEKASLDKRSGVLTLCAHQNWHPLESVGPRGEHRGIGAGIMQTLEKRLGIETVLYPTASWKGALDALVARKCDVLSTAAAGSGLHNQSELEYTTPYYAVPTVVLSRIESPFITTMAELANQPVGITLDFGQYHDLRLRHPNLNLIPVSSESEGLQKVQRGELYGYIGTLASTSQQLQDLRLANIRVIGRVPVDTTLAIATLKAEPALASVMQKAVNSITPAEFNEIETQWRTVELKERIDYTLVWQIILGTVVMLGIFLIWNRKLSYLNRKLAAANAQLARMSTTDPLTGLGNRARFEQTFQQSFQHCQRSGVPFMVAMVDADHFKDVNDTYGHAGGDKCLEALADAMRGHFQRTTDQVIRFGGEEFVVFTPIDPGTDVRQLLESLREDIEMMDIPFESHIIRLTVSIGFHAGIPDKSSLASTWLQIADKTLYEAKNNGRNRVQGTFGNMGSGAS